MRLHTRLVAVLTLALFCPISAEALTSSEISCRKQIAGSIQRHASTAAKITTTCHKNRSGGERPLTDDCNDLNSADVRNLLDRSRDGARERIVSTCSEAASLLDEYTACPSPASTVDDGGPTSGIDNFGEVADCLLALADIHVSQMSGDIQGDPSDRLVDPLLKCQGKLGKFGTRLFMTYLKERSLCQRAADSAGGDAAYTCDNKDPRGKIRKTKAKFASTIENSCFFSPEVLAKLNACDDDLYPLIECTSASASGHGDSVVRGFYELSGSSSGTTTTTLPDPGDVCVDTFPDCNGRCASGSVCSSSSGACICVPEATGPCRPATIRRIIHGKYGSIPSETSLSTGWSGATHDVEIPDGTGDVVDVTCDEHCENCQINLNTQQGNPASNCRCTSNPQTVCNAINGTDSASCGGLDPTCRCYFGSPLALSSGGTPACVVNRIRDDYDGTMNLRSGEWFDQLKLAAVVYLGLSTTEPCPVCNGDPTPNDGIRGGTCAGGATSGACDVNGVHATFGPTSWDCLPPSASNISGTGLLIDLNSSGETQSLSATLPCDTPAGAECHCRVCSGNGNLGCSSNEQCAAANAGTCTAGGGAGVVLNQCDGFACGNDGKCTTGPIDMYCDGAVHPDGRGYVPCSGDSDCTPTGAGTCTVLDKRRCFPDPIVRTGRPDRYEPYTSSLFCIAPTSNAAVNLAAGLPGPGTLTLRFTSDIRCKSDPNLVYEFPGGANCEAGSGTTTTTLLPLPDCEESESPVCGGVCAPGSVCGDSGGTCTCTGIPLPACDEAAAPVCGGFCSDTSMLCQTNSEGHCECQTPTLPQCLNATAPVCGGLCPTGEVCTDVGGSCDCGAPGVPQCASALAPACGGVCDVGSVCAPNAGGTACGCVSLGLPTCGSAIAPTCAGTCAVGSLCQNVGVGCQCVTIPLP